MAFDSRDPFPSLAASSISYADEQAHAIAVDAWLGLEIAAVERELMARGCRSRAPSASGDVQELWFGLAASSLLTPYLEIRRILQAIDLRAGQTVVDLGTAYGRMGFVVARCYPGAKFIGYEFAGERVREGNRALARFIPRASPAKAASDVRIEHADLASPQFAPAPADAYFIYDFGAPKAIEKALHDLRRQSARRPFFLAARGARCRESIQERHRWLAKVDWLAEGLSTAGQSSLYRAGEQRK